MSGKAQAELLRLFAACRGFARLRFCAHGRAADRRFSARRRCFAINVSFHSITVFRFRAFLAQWFQGDGEARYAEIGENGQDTPVRVMIVPDEYGEAWYD